MTRILRHTVPLDGQIHTIAIPEFSRIVGVAPGWESARTILFWTESDPVRHSGGSVERRFIGLPDMEDITGDIPFRFRHVGTAVDYGLRLVWHLCEEVE